MYTTEDEKLQGQMPQSLPPDNMQQYVPQQAPLQQTGYSYETSTTFNQQVTTTHAHHPLPTPPPHRNSGGFVHHQPIQPAEVYVQPQMMPQQQAYQQPVIMNPQQGYQPMMIQPQQGYQGQQYYSTQPINNNSINITNPTPVQNTNNNTTVIQLIAGPVGPVMPPPPPPHPVTVVNVILPPNHSRRMYATSVSFSTLAFVFWLIHITYPLFLLFAILSFLLHAINFCVHIGHEDATARYYAKQSVVSAILLPIGVIVLLAIDAVIFGLVGGFLGR